MKNIVFGLIIFLELYCMALVVISSKDRKEIIDSMHFKETKKVPYLKELFTLMFIFLSLFLIFVNVFKIYSPYKVFGACTRINQLRTYLILYTGTNSLIISLYLFSKFSNTIK